MRKDPLLQRITVNLGIFGRKPVIRVRRLARSGAVPDDRVANTMRPYRAALAQAAH